MTGNHLGLGLAAAMAVLAGAVPGLAQLGPQEHQMQTLSTLIVESAREGALTRESAPAGILGDRSPLELPFVSSSITEYAIREFAVPGGDSTEFASVLSLNPSIRDGVSIFTEMYIRGFRITGYDIGVNGLASMFGPLYVPSFAFESIDVLSGPSIAYMGTTSAFAGTGGHVNYSTKVARPEPQTDVYVHYFGRSGFTEQIDFGRRFGEGNEWGLRATAENTSGETQIIDSENRRLNIMVNLDRKTDMMRTNVAIGHFRYADTGNYGGRNFFIDERYEDVTVLPEVPRTNDGFGPDWNETRQDLTLVTANHEQTITKWLIPFMDFGYSVEKSLPRITTTRLELRSNDGDYSGRTRDEKLKRETMTVQGGVRGTFDLGVMENSYLVAAGYTRHERDESGTAPYTQYYPLGNIYSGVRPDYSAPDNVSNDMRKGYTTGSTGFTLMDTMSFWKEVIGIRRLSLAQQRCQEF
ncbi:MAG: hypothetical protein LBR80_18150 [Deltaproteobacteria bacterium]|nr:hypothetical protein [Deltaproteobacteria bacterium]